MEDKITHTTEEFGAMTMTVKDETTGESIKMPVDTKTIYTHYESGRKDCNVIVLKPIDMGSKHIDPV